MYPYGYGDEVFDKAIEESYNQDYITDPIQSSNHMFLFLKSLDKGRMFSLYQRRVDDIINEKLTGDLQLLSKKFSSHFISNIFAIIKVDLPVETLHALQIISVILHNDESHRPFFFENFFCYEDSDIYSFFSDWSFENRIKYYFIIHPEFLSPQNELI